MVDREMSVVNDWGLVLLLFESKSVETVNERGVKFYKALQNM